MADRGYGLTHRSSNKQLLLRKFQMRLVKDFLFVDSRKKLNSLTSRFRHEVTLLKQTIEKSIYKDCGEGKVLIRLKIQS